MKKVIAVLFALLLGVSLVGCVKNAGSSAKKRISMIATEGLVQRYIYDDAGNLRQIIEYEASDDVSRPSHNYITFNADGSIASVTSSDSELTGEVISKDTWRLSSGVFSITVTYDDNHFVTKQVIQPNEDCSITTEIERDASGKTLKMTSRLVEAGYEYEPTVTTFNYDYDEADNYVVQYCANDADGVSIGEVYAWE